MTATPNIDPDTAQFLAWFKDRLERERNEAEHRRLATKIDLILYRLSGTVARLSLATLRTIAEALEADPAVKEGRQ